MLPNCSYVGRLVRHAPEDSGPKSVLYHSLSVCICSLDPKQLVASSYQPFKGHASHGSSVIASQDTVWCLLEGLGMLLLLLFGGMTLYHP